MEGLKKCVVSGCNAMEILAEGKELEEDIFPNLEDLRLHDLLRSSNIVEGHVSPRSFANLKFLSLEKRDNLRYIFSWSMIKQLPKLETLYISNCKNLEDFFEENATETEIVNYELPSLKFFPLKCLPKIFSIDKIVPLALSSIEEVYTIHCISVKSLPRSLVNAPRLMIVTGQRKWWDEELQWEDYTIKQQLQPLFKVHLDLNLFLLETSKIGIWGKQRSKSAYIFCLLFFCLLCLAAENEFLHCTVQILRLINDFFSSRNKTPQIRMLDCL